jgi:lysyl-tRNA synthetase class 2
MLGETRAFFISRNILEVDCPALTSAASIDAHIDLIPATFHKQQIRYLHTSPEYAMKRLLSEGIGDIYQLGHVYRDGEVSERHQPEFMMIEWYRIELSFEKMIEETLALIELFIGKKEITRFTYRQLFEKYTGINPLIASIEELIEFCEKIELAPYRGIELEGVDGYLNLILGGYIEPQLQAVDLLILSHFPPSQAALSKVVETEEGRTAHRFEIYGNGLELCNGYEELVDATEQRARLEESNHLRTLLGKERLPIDEKFLAALNSGLPNCSGVAVGFDRLMMLRHKKRTIDAVIPLSWQMS